MVFIKIINLRKNPISTKVKIKRKKYVHVSPDKKRSRFSNINMIQNKYKEKASSHAKNNKLLLIKVIVHQNYSNHELLHLIMGFLGFFVCFEIYKKKICHQ